MRRLAGVGRARRRRGATSRWSSAAASPAPTPRWSSARPEPARAVRWRTPSRRPAAAASTRSRSRASSACSPRRPPRTSRKLFSDAELADSGDGPGPRREPRRALRREGSLPQAVSARGRAGRDRAGGFFGRARQLRRAARRVRAARRGGARPPPHRVDRAVADARPRQRVGRGAGRARRRQGAVLRAAPLPLPAVPPRRRAREPAPRLRRHVSGGRDRARSRRRTTGTCWQLLGEFLRFRCHVGRAQGGAGARRELRGLRRRPAAGQGRADPHRPFRQLGGGDDRRHRASIRQLRGRFHFVRRAFKPRWLDALVTRRFNQAGFGVHRQARLARPDPRPPGRRRRHRVSVRPARRAAGRHRGRVLRRIRPGRSGASRSSRSPPARRCCPPRAGARPTGATCCASSEPIAPIEAEDTNEAIRRTTRAYNAALERLVLAPPEQWYWVHRRWKASEGKSTKRRLR